MVHARHSDPNTLSRHLHTYEWHRLAKYLLGDEGRTIVSNLFRGLSVTRNPNLWQRLSAEKQDELGNTKECHALKEEVSALNGDRQEINQPSRDVVPEETQAVQQPAPRLAKAPNKQVR